MRASPTRLSTSPSLYLCTLHPSVAYRFWAPNSEAAGTSLKFYKCHVSAACLSGVNGTRSECAKGYSGMVCSVCSVGYVMHAGARLLCRSPFR